MNWQVIILCDLKIKISFVQYIKIGFILLKRKVYCTSETKHTHFIQRFLRKLGTIYNCQCLLNIDDTVTVTKFSETPIYCRRGLKSAIMPKIKHLCFFLEGWTRWGGVSPFHPSPTPCLPPPLFELRALRTRKFISSFSLPSFPPIFLPSPSLPLFSLPASSPPSPTPSFPNSLLPCPPPHEQVTKRLVYQIFTSK